MSAARFSDRGICVSDLDASLGFYAKALGFQPVADAAAAGDLRALASAELGVARLRERRVADAQRIALQLFEFQQPPASGPRERRPTNRYGLTHLAFYVDDIDAAAARVVASGGRAYPHTRASYAANRTSMLYCTDPDGVRIELMHAPGEAARFSHSGICVADSAAAAAFYQGLGFALAENYELRDEPWLETMNELPGAKLRAQMVRDAAGNTIELLQLYEPGCSGPREPGPLNRFGLAYLAFATDALAADADAIAASGGRRLPGARVRSDELAAQACSDPDGVRLHLRERRARA